MSSPGVEVSRTMHKGYSYYRERNYTAAIAEFTKALELRDVPFTVQVDILDSRAAAREMIGGTVNLELALQDAKMMTQLSKADDRGYSRAGMILELLNRDKSALDIYADGVEQMEPDSPQFEFLDEMFKKVQDRVKLREVRDTRCDPLNHLPTEMAESALQYLPFHELMIAQRVSRTWRSFIRASRKTYTCLDFSAAKRVVSDSTLRAYISRSGGNVREAVLCKFSHKSTLWTIVHQCRQLSKLSILSVSYSQIIPYILLRETRVALNLAVLITDLRFPMDSFRGILEGCASLRGFECKGITWSSPTKPFTANLRRLKIWDDNFSFTSPSPEGLLRDIVKCLPKLEDVEIRGPFFNSIVDFRSLQSLSVLSLNRSHTRAFPLLPESVRVLDISENSLIRWSLEDLAASPLPNLESFNAEYSPHMNNAHVLAILAPSLEKRSLRSLNLYMCPNMDFNSLEWLVKHGENLEELAIGGNIITDEVSGEVAKFKKLKYLDLGYSGISRIGLMNVINGSPGVLREVDITACMEIDLDAVQLAAESGVKLIERRWG